MLSQSLIGVMFSIREYICYKSLVTVSQNYICLSESQSWQIVQKKLVVWDNKVTNWLSFNEDILIYMRCMINNKCHVCIGKYVVGIARFFLNYRPMAISVNILCIRICSMSMSSSWDLVLNNTLKYPWIVLLFNNIYIVWKSTH